MIKDYTYFGNERLAPYVEARLKDAGWSRSSDDAKIHAAITYFTSLSALEDAYFADGGIIGSLDKGSLIIDLSPGTPSLAREIAAMCSVNDLHFIEAPLGFEDLASDDVFKGSEGAVCYVSGDKEDIDGAMPILEALSSNVECVGGAGSAQLAKSLATIQQAAHILADIECEALVSAVADSAADGKWGVVAELNQNRRGDSSGTFGQGAGKEGVFTVEMHMAEVAAALAAAEDVDLVLPQLDSCMRLLEVLALIGGVDMSPYAISLLYCDEDRGKLEGLDWKRAQDLYDGDEEWPISEEDDDYENWDDGLDEGPFGAYGRYSSN